MKQIKIEQLLPLLKSGWVAMDEDGRWVWYNEKPICCINGRCGVSEDADAFRLSCFNIASARGCNPFAIATDARVLRLGLNGL